MRGEVEVGAVGDALELAPLRALEAEAVFDVRGALGVVAELVQRVLEEAQVFLADAQAGVPGHALLHPVLVPLLVRAGLDEEFHFHLLELAGAEDEVARRDLVAEGLADLADAERRLLAGGGEDIVEVHEDALGGFGAQVVQALFAGDRAEVGLEQAGEFLRLGPFAAGAAVGAGDVLEPVLGGTALLLLVFLLEVVRAVALVAGEALHQRVGEDLDVAGGLPDLAGQDDGGVQADDVFAAADHGLPPLALDVFLELGAEGPVVPGRTGATIDFTGLENETPALGEGNDLVEDGFCCHGNSNFYRAAGCGPRSAPRIPGWCRTEQYERCGAGRCAS